MIVHSFSENSENDKISKQLDALYLIPQLIWKELSTNSHLVFEHVLTLWTHTEFAQIIFCPESTGTKWRCNQFSKKMAQNQDQDQEQYAEYIKIFFEDFNIYVRPYLILYAPKWNSII